jgi:hypothetical protein
VFILFFGTRTRERLVTTSTMVCEVCGVPATQTLTRRTTKFTLFFVPLFPVRPSVYHLRCAHCGARRPAHPDTVARQTA